MLHAPAELAGRLLDLEQRVDRAIHNRRKCKALLQAARSMVRSVEIAQMNQGGSAFTDGTPEQLHADAVSALDASVTLVEGLQGLKKHSRWKRVLSAPGRLSVDLEYDEVLKRVEQLRKQVQMQRDGVQSTPSGSFTRHLFMSSNRASSEIPKARDFLRYSVDVNRSSDSSTSSRQSMDLRRSVDSAPQSALVSQRGSRQWFRGILERPSGLPAHEDVLSEAAVMRAVSTTAASQSPMHVEARPLPESEPASETRSSSTPTSKARPPSSSSSAGSSTVSSSSVKNGEGVMEYAASQRGEGVAQAGPVLQEVSPDVPQPSSHEKAPEVVGSSKGNEGEEGEKSSIAQAPSPARSAKPEPSGSSLLAWAPRGRVAMSLSSWIIDFKNLTFKRKIGEGSVGTVHLGRWQETDVAIKVLASLRDICVATDSMDAAPWGALVKDETTRGDPEMGLRSLEREMGIMASIRHPNVVLFMGVCLEPPCIVTEWCGRGSLYDVLAKGRRNRALAAQLDWPRRLGMALDAAKGMLQLHQRKPPIIHRDLKSPNLLVDKYWRCKVADFNLSRQQDQSPMVASITANNPRWLAPEVITHMIHSPKADVYAFAIVLWELLVWSLPWEDMGTFQIIVAIAERRQRPEIPADLDALPGGSFPGMPEYLALMKRCWAEEPRQRPAFDEVICDLRNLMDAATRFQGPPPPALQPPALPEQRSVQHARGLPPHPLQVTPSPPFGAAGFSPPNAPPTPPPAPSAPPAQFAPWISPFASPFHDANLGNASGLRTKADAGTQVQGLSPVIPFSATPAPFLLKQPSDKNLPPLAPPLARVIGSTAPSGASPPEAGLSRGRVSPMPARHGEPLSDPRDNLPFLSPAPSGGSLRVGSPGISSSGPSNSSLASLPADPDWHAHDGGGVSVPEETPSFRWGHLPTGGDGIGGQGHLDDIDAGQGVDGGQSSLETSYSGRMPSIEEDCKSPLVGTTSHTATRAFLRAPAGNSRDGPWTVSGTAPNPSLGSTGTPNRSSIEGRPKVRFGGVGHPESATLSPSPSSALSRGASTSLGMSIGALSPATTLSRDLGELRSYVTSRATSLSSIVEAQRTEPGGSSTRLADLATAYAQLASLLQAEGMAPLPIPPLAPDSTPLTHAGVGGGLSSRASTGLDVPAPLPPFISGGAGSSARARQEYSSGTDGAAVLAQSPVQQELAAMRLEDEAWSS